MRILLIHNKYRQPGGEDSVFREERALLVDKGHTVSEFILSNEDMSRHHVLRQAQYVIWNNESYNILLRRIAESKPDVIHIHNTFALMSPSVIWAAAKAEIPVVMTLHNYRLLCLNALFFRNGRVCEACLGRNPWPGVVHACYKGSRAASGVIATMLGVHRAIGTWTRKVNTYVALTEFARQKFIEGGLPAGKITVKPNFVYPDPGPGDGRGGFALFAGRLSVEKGIETLLAAWEQMGGRIPLKIVGDGPSASRVVEASRRSDSIEWLGRKPREWVIAFMKQASFLVFPSQWYEGFPMIITEAFATGLPVVASNLGAAASLIENGRTGLHFSPGDPEELAAKVEWLLAHPVELARMRIEARAEYEAKYMAEQNYQMLMAIYERALVSER